MIWVFVGPHQLAGGELTIDGPKAHHLLRVLRVRPGERGVAVCERVEHSFEITRVERERVVGRVLGTASNFTEPVLRLTLLQALLPHPDFDAVLEAATALGVSRFIPVRTARSVARAAGDRRPRWQAIAQSAAEQSHRGLVPEVLSAHSLAEALGAIAGDPLLVLDPGATTPLRQAVSPGAPHSLAVGPEGGWTPDELDQMRAAGGRSVGLGPRVLRARLAGVVATAILMDHADRPES